MSEININKVHPNPNQPRQHFDEEKLKELAENIKEHGLIQSIVIRPNGDDFIIVTGERRWRACKLAGLSTIRAEIREVNTDDAYTISLVENEQREDISPIETATAIKKMMDSQKLTQAQVAKRISKDRTWVAQKLRMLNLSSEVQDFIKTDNLSEGHARQLLKLQTAKLNGKVEEIAQQAVNNNWSVSRITSEVDLAIIGNNSESVSRDTPKTIAYSDSLPENDVSQDTPTIQDFFELWEILNESQRIEIHRFITRWGVTNG